MTQLDNIGNINTYILILSLVFLIIAFSLIISPYKSFKENINLTLTLISRITEMEAESEII